MQNDEKTPALVHTFTVQLPPWTYYDHPNAQHVTAPGETISGTIRLDLDSLAVLLANRARKTSNRISTLADGRIHCHLTRIQQHLDLEVDAHPPGTATDRQLLAPGLRDPEPPSE